MQQHPPSSPSVAPRRPVVRYAWQLMREGAALVRRGGVRLIGLLLAAQLIIVGVTFPLFGWVFRQALRAAGMTGLDLAALQVTRLLPVSIGLLLIIVVLALWLVSLQFAAVVIVLDNVRDGAPLTAASFAAGIRQVAAKLWRPSALPLIGYLFLVVPLGGFGFASVMTQGISLPRFVSGELTKSTSGTLLLALFIVLIVVANLRWCLTMPLFSATTITGRAALRNSRRLTRGRGGVSIALAVAGVTTVISLTSVIALVVGGLPTVLSDALRPAASPWVAGLTLGSAQVFGAALTGLATAWIAAILITYMHDHRDQLVEAPALPAPQSSPRLSIRMSRSLVITGSLIAAVGLGLMHVPAMQSIADVPETLVVAHRGYEINAPENTIAALEDAAAVGVDVVEIDIMQTRDGDFIVMHDMNLRRLTGNNVNVKDLTTAEIREIPIVDDNGATYPIPTLEEFVVRADELDMPLLIEVKKSGAETPDYVERIIAELEELDLLETNIYHSLDAPVVETLKLLRPDLTVGYTMAFAAQRAPETPADFIVVEQWTAGRSVQASTEAEGYGFWVWTVNDTASIREYIRRGSDGIITDDPEQVLSIREEIAEEKGLSGTLFDALSRFITAI